MRTYSYKYIVFIVITICFGNVARSQIDANNPISRFVKQYSAEINNLGDKSISWEDKEYIYSEILESFFVDDESYVYNNIISGGSIYLSAKEYLVSVKTKFPDGIKFEYSNIRIEPIVLEKDYYKVILYVDVKVVTVTSSNRMVQKWVVKGNSLSENLFSGRILTIDEASDLNTEEVQYWNDVLDSNTVEAYRGYLLKFPNGIYESEAKNRLNLLEQNLWARISNGNNIQQFSNYIRLFPDGIYYQEAIDRINDLNELKDWNQAKSQGSYNGYSEYLDKHPNGKYKLIAIRELESIELSFWEEVKRQNNLESYEEYLKRFPKGEYSDICFELISGIKKDQDLRNNILMKLEMIQVPSGILKLVEQRNGISNTYRLNIESFKICKVEVTQGVWTSVIGENPSYFYNCDMCPVEYVSFNDIKDFIKKLNQLTGLNYRLPTEFEWEYVFSLNDKSNPIIRSYDTTLPVGFSSPGDLGVFNLSNNVSEICDTPFLAFGDLLTQKDLAGEYKKYVVRGGNWKYNSSSTDLNRRSAIKRSDKNALIGFRLVLDN